MEGMRELRITIHISRDERTDRIKARIDAGEKSWAEYEGTRGDWLARCLSDGVFNDVHLFVLNEKQPVLAPESEEAK